MEIPTTVDLDNTFELDFTKDGEKEEELYEQVFIQEYDFRYGISSKQLLWILDIGLFLYSFAKYIVRSEICGGFGSTFALTPAYTDSSYPGIISMKCEHDDALTTMAFCTLLFCILLTYVRIFYWAIQLLSLILFTSKYLAYIENIEGIEDTTTAKLKYGIVSVLNLLDILMFWVLNLTLYFHIRYSRKKLTPEEEKARAGTTGTARTGSYAKSSGYPKNSKNSKN